MFERYTERARRVVFFARYEASNYGSPFIETEHLLLGLLREATPVLRHLLHGVFCEQNIREQIERQIQKRERISTSVELPLTRESKSALSFAADEAERLGQTHVGTEHLLLGLLRVDKGLAVEVLKLNHIDLQSARQKLAQTPPPLPAMTRMSTRSPASYAATALSECTAAFEALLDKLRAGQSDEFADALAPQAQYIDAFGQRWSGREELHWKVAAHFEPFATKHARYVIERIVPADPAAAWIANVLWEDVPQGDKALKDVLRMTVLFSREEQDWKIFMIQVTPVVRPY